jgi:hypothetical protein
VGEEEQRDGLPGAEDGALEEFAEYISSEPCAISIGRSYLFKRDSTFAREPRFRHLACCLTMELP